MDQIQLIAQELAAATHTSLAGAHNHVDLVIGVGRDLSASWVALDHGEITLAHVKALNRVTSHCPPRVVAAVDAQIVPLAVTRGWTPSELAKHARKALIAIDPEGAALRAIAAKANADVHFYPDVDETATLAANGDAIMLREVFDTVNDRAAQMGRAGDLRPVGVRRLAALADAVLNTRLVGLDSPATNNRRTRSSRSRRHANIVIDLPTALGLSDNPGELTGYGPISAETAREIAQDATLRRLITDPINGRCIDLGRTSYPPSEALRRFVVARDRVCTFPGCCRPAVDCECDHRKDWSQHGRTDGDNLHSLCKLHHSFKTKKLWRVTVDRNGCEVWTSPFGFVYRRRDDDYPIEQLEPPGDDHIAEDASEDLLSSDPDPPREDDPLPESPDLTLEEYLTYSDDLDRACFRAACFNYDAFYAEQRAS
jgi:Domain of unknown function (DUF222)